MTYPKRLIEVDLPIKRISAHARREKSIRHGHISTLHIWWARRPLAACRAVICAALWPDPADEDCPSSFRNAAAKAIVDFARKMTSDNKLAEKHCSPENFKAWSKLAAANASPSPGGEGRGEGGRSADYLWLRTALLDFIADFANWDNSTVQEYLDTSRTLTMAAHEALGGGPGTRPLVVDPFAGGGSIPLEALRVGADAFASDLNPVPVLLNKVLLEYIPKYGQRLADEVRKWGEWIKREAEKELAEFYPCLPAGRPRTPDEATPGKFYAYVLRCSDGSLYKGQTDDLPRRFKQHCNGEVEWTKAHLPVDLIHFEEFDTREESVEREKWLKTGVGREWLASKFPKETPIAYLWARTIQCEGPGCGAELPLIGQTWLSTKDGRKRAFALTKNAQTKSVAVTVVKSPKEGDVMAAISKKSSATCPLCGYTTPAKRVREVLSNRNGGSDSARLLAVVTTHPHCSGKDYRAPHEQDLRALKAVGSRLSKLEHETLNGLPSIPHEDAPPDGALGFRIQKYGIRRWRDLYTQRQLVLKQARYRTTHA